MDAEQLLLHWRRQATRVRSRARFGVTRAAGEAMRSSRTGPRGRGGAGVATSCARRRLLDAARCVRRSRPTSRRVRRWISPELESTIVTCLRRPRPGTLRVCIAEYQTADAAAAAAAGARARAACRPRSVGGCATHVRRQPRRAACSTAAARPRPLLISAMHTRSVRGRRRAQVIRRFELRRHPGRDPRRDWRERRTQRAGVEQIDAAPQL